MKDIIMNNLIVIFINLKIKMILKKNLIFQKVNFQVKEHLELLNNVKVIMIKINMQLNQLNKQKVNQNFKKLLLVKQYQSLIQNMQLNNMNFIIDHI